MKALSANIKIPFIDLSLQHKQLKAKLIRAVEQVLDHGQFILGPEVGDFEKRFAEYCGVAYAVGVDNGTSALILVLRALGIGHGDEVITPPNSFISSASCIISAGARPVFVDVSCDYNIDYTQIEKAITPRTKAIIPVHLTGHPAEMTPIMEIADRYDLYVIEDCAQAVGARYSGKGVGSFGKAGCFSFHPLKILNAVGDGGIVTTNDAMLYEKLIKARNHGLRTRDECDFWSGNFRLDTIQAAMLLVKMDYLTGWIECRRNITAFYREHLMDVVTVPEDQSDKYDVYQTFVIQTECRDDLQRYLSEQLIETKVHYPIPLHLQIAAQGLGYKKGDFPVAESLSDRILSLPIYPELTQIQIERVISAIRDFYDKYN